MSVTAVVAYDFSTVDGQIAYLLDYLHRSRRRPGAKRLNRLAEIADWAFDVEPVSSALTTMTCRLGDCPYEPPWSWTADETAAVDAAWLHIEEDHPGRLLYGPAFR